MRESIRVLFTNNYVLTHTLTHNRKAAGGRGGLFSKSNLHFPSHAAPIRSEITPFFLQGDFGTKRPCVQVTSLRPVKEPGNRVFMRFPGVSVYLWFPAFFARDPYRDPYGIWATGHSSPDICPERPHAGVLADWVGLLFPPLSWL